ncbi:MAG TPA: hypothetical protein VFQ90_02385, partial [Stellaceae bacterium]|nr:hypothetical protein [Stellaceae bacterium]
CRGAARRELTRQVTPFASSARRAPILDLDCIQYLGLTVPDEWLAMLGHDGLEDREAISAAGLAKPGLRL